MCTVLEISISNDWLIFSILAEWIFLKDDIFVLLKINEERCRMPQESKPALLIKIAPMISEDVAEDIADICLNKEVLT